MKYTIALAVVAFAGFLAAPKAHASDDASWCIQRSIKPDGLGSEEFHLTNTCNAAISILVEGSNGKSWGPFQVDSENELTWDANTAPEFRFVACVSPWAPKNSSGGSSHYYDNGFYCK